MSIFSVHSLCKSFKVPKNKTGFLSSLRAVITRQHEEQTALDHVHFNIAEGELVGYIGPNGAGKSTTVKILSGILVPDSGQVCVLGKTPWKHRLEVVRQIGVVFGQRTQLWWDLQVIDSFDLLKAIYSIAEQDYKRKLDELVHALNLSDLLHVPVRMLSLGQRMRCDLAASLLHSPRVLFLDEPTIGLDAISKLAMRDFIRKLNREHLVTILLTTHDMDDIESLCNRVMILNKGTIDFDGSLEQLRKKISPERRLVMDMSEEIKSIQDKDARWIKQQGNRIWLGFDPSIVSTTELIARITSQHSVIDLFVENPPIEELVAQLYGNGSI